ncbi:MAG: lipoprotein-anchoring transpeptidase ErfK/SrfK [Verrucomicrobiales bacterium]|jgi:lipoprotein-anchoring transpeptidase ErfK/SrfK
MNPRSFRLLLICLASFALGASCSAIKMGSNKPFSTPAKQAVDKSKIRVKVSLSNRMVYVKEGDKTLLATPTAIGTAANPTPTGDFRTFNRLPRKRSNTYGFHVHSDGMIRGGKRTATPSGARYVGYPMPYWVEFKSGYGFHSGSVWPTPRSHGCLRLHKNVAPTFFDLVGAGVPVSIAHSQPEDATVGKNVPRPTDYDDDDPPASYTITQKYFDDHPSKPSYVN